jgi:hypothetical protein
VRATDITASECGDPVRIAVAGAACRFGTAAALVDEVPGATYRWTIEGGAILSGDGTRSPLFSFGDGTAAVIHVEITTPACTRTGTATIALRAPFAIDTLTASAANVGVPLTLTWTYRDAASPRTQTLTIAGQAVPLPLDARTYTFTPTSEGQLAVKLAASLIGGRRRVAAPPSFTPSPSLCASDTRSLVVDVRPACTPPDGSIAVSGPTAFCDGSSVTLTAPEGTAYGWNTGAQSRAITVHASGQYQVRVANGQGCERIFGPVTVTVMPPPAIALSLSPSTIMTGGQATLTVTCAQCAGGSVTSARGASSLTPNGGAFSGSGMFTFAFTDTQGPATLGFTATGLPVSPCDVAATDQKTLSIVASAPAITNFSVNPSSIGRFPFGPGSCSLQCATTTVAFTATNATSWIADTASHLNGWWQDSALQNAYLGTAQLFSNPDGSGSPTWTGSGDGAFSRSLVGFLPASDEVIVTATGPGGTATARLPLRVNGCDLAFHREDFQAGSNTITVAIGATVTLRIAYIGPDASTLSASSSLGNTLTPTSRAVPQNYGIYSFQYMRSIAGDDTVSISSSACGATLQIQVK